MRWEEVVVVFSDWRMQFLAGIVLLTLFVAGTLTLAERHIREKRRIANIHAAQEAFITELRKNRDGSLSPREKLDHLDTLAKQYFAEVYGTPVHSDYSYLKKIFLEKQKGSLVDFCTVMFSAYYLKRDSDGVEVQKAYDLFLKAYRQQPSETDAVSSLGDLASSGKVSQSPIQLPEKATECRETASSKVDTLAPVLSSASSSSRKRNHSSNKIKPMPPASPLFGLHESRQEKKPIIMRIFTPKQRTNASIESSSQQLVPPPAPSMLSAGGGPALATSSLQPNRVSSKDTDVDLKRSGVSDKLTVERKQWLAQMNRRKREQIITSRKTGTYDWLSEVRKELNIK